MSYSLSNSRTYITSDNDNHKTSIWYRRSRLEKVLLIFVLFLTLLSIGLLIGLIFEANKNKESETPDDTGTTSAPTSEAPTGQPICNTQTCLIAAAKIQASMDTSVNPCDDFYQYACGNWMKTNIIPPDRSRWGQFDITRQSLADNVRVLLDSSDEDNNYQNLPIITKTKNLYKACSNLNERISGRERLREILVDIDWPLLNPNGDESSLSWQQSYIKLNQKFGVSFILSNYVAQDAKNTSIYSIYIDAPSFGTGRSQLINPNTTNNQKILAAYKTFMKNSIELLGGSSDDTYIDEMIEFETQLALNISDNRTNRFELYGNKTTIGEFDRNHPILRLLDMEKEIFQSIPINIDENEGLIVYDKEYFSNLGEIIENFRLRTIVNYLGWRTIRLLGPYTDSNFRNYEFEYNKVVTGVQELKPIWEECVDITNARLPFAVGRLYVDQHFSEDAKSDLLEMINQLEASFKQLLETNEWMDEITKNNTREKLEYIERAIAYPDFLQNNDSLEDYYSGVNDVNENFFFLAIEDLLSWSTQRSFKRIHNDASNRTELDWSTGPAIVNAFYSPNINRITFPAGILQTPFYTFGLPASLNLAAIGMVIGHEITHGFDNSGSQYDKLGNLYDWWDNNTRTEFQERVNCFINQYTNYNDSLAGRPLNGTKTVGENIADNGGIRQAFRALENYNGIKYALPGSMQNFTSEQLFFLSFANIWCSNLRRESMISAIENEAHSPGKYRVIGSVSNSEGFAKAFNCANNTNMNPPVEDKCIIW